MQGTNPRVMGTDQSRVAIRSKVWSTTVRYGPPTLWVTINPSNLHDPIAQVLTGENLSMDNFNDMLGPSVAKRAENIASDPHAAAKFIHFFIHLILHTLFGVVSSGWRVTSMIGVFGKVAAYIGVVESQNHASPSHVTLVTGCTSCG